MTAALLDERHTGATYSLSGPRTLTMAEVAAELSAATGRPISYVDLEPEQHVAELVELRPDRWRTRSRSATCSR